MAVIRRGSPRLDLQQPVQSLVADEEEAKTFTPIALFSSPLPSPRRPQSNLLKYCIYAALISFAGIVFSLASSIAAPGQKHTLRSAEAPVKVARECKYDFAPCQFGVTGR